MTPSPRSVTIQEVADLADVSAKTVSRVLNHEPGVHVETKNRILKAIEQLMQRKVTAVDHRLVEMPSEAAPETPRRGRPAQAPKGRRRGGNRTPHSSDTSWTRTPHSSEAPRTRTPHISEIPMLAAPTTKRGQVSRHSGGGHR